MAAVREAIGGKTLAVDCDLREEDQVAALFEAAIGRFQRVVDDFQTTNHVPEALQRLTELYLLLGLPDEARKTAAVLGHNYPGSSWYKDSYDQLVAAGQITTTGQEPTAGKPEEKPGWFSRNLSIF